MTDAIEKAIEALEWYIEHDDANGPDEDFYMQGQLRAKTALQALREHKAKQAEVVADFERMAERLNNVDGVFDWSEEINSVRQALTQGDGNE